MPCCPISVLTENLSWATNLFFLPRHPPFLTQPKSTQHLQENSRISQKNTQIDISLKLLQTLPSKLFRRIKIVLMKRSQNLALRVGASQFHMQASCRVMKWWNKFWIFQAEIIQDFWKYLMDWKFQVELFLEFLKCQVEIISEFLKVRVRLRPVLSCSDIDSGSWSGHKYCTGSRPCCGHWWSSNS